MLHRLSQDIPILRAHKLHQGILRLMLEGVQAVWRPQLFIKAQCVPGFAHTLRPTQIVCTQLTQDHAHYLIRQLPLNWGQFHLQVEDACQDDAELVLAAVVLTS